MEICTLSTRLGQLKLTLPAAGGAVGAYVPVKRVRDFVYVSGQLPMKDGALMATGQIPTRCSQELATLAARQCVLNALAAVQAALGSVDVLKGVVRVGAFINSDAAFTQQAKVANGASELLMELFGEAGRHVRAAVGANTLPLDASVEVEFIFHC